MAELTAYAWIAVLGIGLGVVVTMLQTLCNVARTATDTHDLRVRVHELQLEYKRRLLELHGAEGTEEDPIDGVPVEQLASEDVMPA